ncbi:hypothetical protein NLJ89_g6114 [Agrocybe chaxingu]|uniref:Uncharacterized protein n=1 Tax=Agrocybe chaxingu TaxID=84603 RepID=A0A9W8JZX9_9AGAR|nr:hypothetical protein NLJ89_g6114 [Agrocybe chaxingu]
MKDSSDPKQIYEGPETDKNWTVEVTITDQDIKLCNLTAANASISVEQLYKDIEHVEAVNLAMSLSSRGALRPDRFPPENILGVLSDADIDTVTISNDLHIKDRWEEYVGDFRTGLQGLLTSSKLQKLDICGAIQGVPTNALRNETLPSLFIMRDWLRSTDLPDLFELYPSLRTLNISGHLNEEDFQQERGLLHRLWKILSRESPQETLEELTLDLGFEQQFVTKESLDELGGEMAQGAIDLAKFKKLKTLTIHSCLRPTHAGMMDLASHWILNMPNFSQMTSFNCLKIMFDIDFDKDDLYSEISLNESLLKVFTPANSGRNDSGRQCNLDSQLARWADVGSITVSIEINTMERALKGPDVHLAEIAEVLPKIAGHRNTKIKLMSTREMPNKVIELK